MRMRPDLEWRRRFHVIRAHQVDKTPWPDRPSLFGGEDSEDAEVADSSGSALLDLDGVHPEVIWFAFGFVDWSAHLIQPTELAMTSDNAICDSVNS